MEDDNDFVDLCSMRFKEITAPIFPSIDAIREYESTKLRYYEIFVPNKFSNSGIEYKIVYNVAEAPKRIEIGSACDSSLGSVNYEANPAQPT